MKNSALALMFIVSSFGIAQPIRIGIPIGDTAMRLKLQQQVTKAYTQLGYQPQFIALPSGRRLRLLEDGQIDADLFRICQVNEQYTNLLVVPVTLDTLQLNAYSLSKQSLIDWQKRSDLLISHIRGFKMAEQQLFAGERIAVATDEQAFGLMLQGRVDIVLEDSRTAEAFILSQTALPDIAQQEVARFDVCHVLHKNVQLLLAPLMQQLSMENTTIAPSKKPG